MTQGGGQETLVLKEFEEIEGHYFNGKQQWLWDDSS